MTQKIQKKKFILDTSVIVDGSWKKVIEKEEVKKDIEIIIPQVVISEIEHQANKKRHIGFVGLRELEVLKSLADRGEIKELKITGKRPSPDQIKLSKAGELDHLIRVCAKEENGILVTGDVVQATLAKIMGIDTILVVKAKEEHILHLEDFFDENTMSVHIKEGVVPLAKKGHPGNWKLIELSDKPLTREEVDALAINILERARASERFLIEIDEPGATAIQMGVYRIVICRPPFSERLEITAVRPTKFLRLEDYNISSTLMERLEKSAEGILIAGPTGAGKTTFAQALTNFLQEKRKIVKTIEKPRDLQVNPEVTQYTALSGDLRKTAEVLLLLRPDYTIFDEMRNSIDFKVYVDLRFGGVGMIGVVHASTAIDAVHRFIGRVELGQLSHIVDTIIFIKGGKIEKVYSLSINVKVPTGMSAEDLARPVVEVRELDSGELEYEIYSFGEEVVVVPVKELKTERSPVIKFAEKYLEQKISSLVRAKDKVKVKITSENSATIILPEKYIPKIIGKGGKNIDKLEKKFGIHLDVRAMTESKYQEEITKDWAEDKAPSLRTEARIKLTRTQIVLLLDESFEGKDVMIYAEEEALFPAKVGKKGQIKIRKKTHEGELLKEKVASGLRIYVEEI